MEVIALDGRAFGKFIAAGTYFLRKYRGVLDDLNVFPVPDGDTGSNMYLTARAALAECRKAKGQPLSAVAAAAAQGSLLGARGNSGVIFSQMLRGFAHNVRHRFSVDGLDLALAMQEGVSAARGALVKPVEGTILSVASAAADAALALSKSEPDVLRLNHGIVRAAFEALERTPDQLPVLKEAGVVDSGGAGLVYFLEGILRFLPEATSRATAFPRRPTRARTFSTRQSVGENKYCTEFVLEDATIENHALRDVLGAHGDSLLVIGDPPLLKVHVHTADPKAVKSTAARHGRLTREKVEDMERQHNLLLVDRPVKPYSVVAVVSGEGFAQIARELGADSVVIATDANPSVRELLVAVNAALGDRVYLLSNDPNVALAAKEVAALTDRNLTIVPTRDVPSGLAAILELSNAGTSLPDASGLMSGVTVRTATAFFAGKDSQLDGVSVKRGAPAASCEGRLLGAEASLEDAARAAAAELGAEAGGLLTLYYGGAQKERDARQITAGLRSAFPEADVEYYYGGQRSSEYVISLER
ncbi:MAG: DAK2 domain-containing protein [Candidatus Eremiobacteraeota bacterium]|nr:DAK2 domain-containing protein [Candidatus Eremiobacteraeota bacterium]